MYILVEHTFSTLGAVIEQLSLAIEIMVKCSHTQINSECLLCGNAEETVEHYILTCETLENLEALY